MGEKKQKRSLTFLVLFILILSGCSVRVNDMETKEDTKEKRLETILVGDIPINFPLTDKKATLNILASSNLVQDFSKVYVFQKYEEMTGVKVNWTTVSKADRAEAVYNVLINKQDIDVIMRCKISTTRLTQYGESGLILDLSKDDLLMDNAPNCWSYLKTHPDALASITNPDGSIYSIPQINSGAELRVSRKIYVNREWLERLKLDLPKTTEEFYEMLVTFRDEDANGNNDKSDEIPLASEDWLGIEEALLGSFGLGNRGQQNLFIDYDDDLGKTRLIAAADGYKDFLQYFNRLYKENLLDKYIFTVTLDQWQNNIMNDKVGVFMSTNLANLPTGYSDKWIALEEPLEGPNNDKMFAAVRASFHSTGAAVIPASCKNPELVLQWLDYFWTDEGTLFYHMGVEGETYVKNEDGTYSYTEDILDEMKTSGKSFDQVIAGYSPYPGGSNPTVEVAPYFAGGEMAEIPANAARGLYEYGPDEYWPVFTFTAEENDILSTIQTDITKYITTTEQDFITGAMSFSEWSNYQKQLEKLGKKQLLDIYQAAVDRYYVLKEARKDNEVH